jgi:DinB family protein
VSSAPDRRVPIRHTRRRTISRVEAEYRALDRVVRRLGSQLDESVPGFGARARIKRERWTGKDALAHIVAWKQHQLRTLRHEKHDATLRGKPIDVQNRILYRRWHRRTLRDVVAYHRAVHREVIAALRARPESYFADPPRSPLWPNDLLGHAAGHRERHLELLLG